MYMYTLCQFTKKLYDEYVIFMYQVLYGKKKILHSLIKNDPWIIKIKLKCFNSLYPMDLSIYMYMYDAFLEKVFKCV